MIASPFEHVCLGRAERVLHIHDGAALQPQQVDRTLRNTRFISVRVRHDDILVFDDALGDGDLDLALPALPFLASELRGCPTSMRQLRARQVRGDGQVPWGRGEWGRAQLARGLHGRRAGQDRGAAGAVHGSDCN